MRLLYMVSLIILWACIAVNVYNLLSLREQRKKYLTATAEVNEAYQKFLDAYAIYNRSAEELRAEKEYLRTLQESEENSDG